MFLFYKSDIIKHITKNRIPSPRVNLLKNNSNPLSFLFLNKSEDAPNNILETDSDLSLCNNTTVINKTDITNNTTSILTSSQ